MKLASRREVSPKLVGSVSVFVRGFEKQLSAPAHIMDRSHSNFPSIFRTFCGVDALTEGSQIELFHICVDRSQGAFCLWAERKPWNVQTPDVYQKADELLNLNPIAQSQYRAPPANTSPWSWRPPKKRNFGSSRDCARKVAKQSPRARVNDNLIGRCWKSEREPRWSYQSGSQSLMVVNDSTVVRARKAKFRGADKTKRIFGGWVR